MKTVLSCPFFFLLTVSASAQNATDEGAIQQIVEDMATAWTAGSGEGFARHFANDHDYVVWNGLYMAGASRSENAESHQRIFDTQYKNTEHHATLDKIRFIREDIALIHVYSAIVSAGEGRPENPQVLWSALLEKQSGDWKIIAFHNVDLKIFKDEELRKAIPAPPQALYTNWYKKQ